MNLEERVAYLEKEVRRLRAIDGIKDTIARYSWAVDTEDWAEFDAIYTDDIVIDRSWRNEYYTGKAVVLDFFKRHRQQVRFSNRMSNLNERITVDGDKAKAVSYALVMYTYNNESYIGWGNYEWHLRFENDMWRIFRQITRINVMTTLKRGWGMDTDRVLTLPHLAPNVVLVSLIAVRIGMGNRLTSPYFT